VSNYIRVLPRDLFNEASLFKCVARLWILTDDRRDHQAKFVTEDVEVFNVLQDQSSGAIYIGNVEFTVRGVPHRLSRPLNARSAWPLYMDIEDGDETLSVFDDDGNLSAEMLTYISRER